MDKVGWKFEVFTEDITWKYSIRYRIDKIILLNICRLFMQNSRTLTFYRPIRSLWYSRIFCTISKYVFLNLGKLFALQLFSPTLGKYFITLFSEFQAICNDCTAFFKWIDVYTQEPCFGKDCVHKNFKHYPRYFVFDVWCKLTINYFGIEIFFSAVAWNLCLHPLYIAVVKHQISLTHIFYCSFHLYCSF